MIEQCIRRAAGCASREYAGIILDPLAEAYLLEHLDIIQRALFYPLSLDELALVLEILYPLGKLAFYLLDRAVYGILGYDIMRRGIYGCVGKMCDDIASERVYLGYAVYLVTEKFHAQSGIGRACGEYLHNVAVDTEFISREIDIVALVLYRNESPEQILP